MPIVGFPIYCNVPRLNIVVTKNVILFSVIFSQKAFPLYDDLSTDNIVVLT